MPHSSDGERAAASSTPRKTSSSDRKADAPRGPSPSEFDPIPQAHVTEDSSESAWRRFEALLKGEAADFDSTQSTLHVPKNSLDWQNTSAGTLPGIGERLALQADLNDVLAFARSANRASPTGPAWDDLFHLLPPAEHGGQTFAPPPPLPIDQSTPIQRRLRLRDQIEWAEVAGVLPQVHTFLSGLSIREWTYFDRS